MSRAFEAGLLRFLAVVVAAMAPGCADTVRSNMITAKDQEKRQAALAASDLLIIPGERIGPIRLGLSKAEIAAKLGPADTEVPKAWFFYDLNLAEMFDDLSGRVDRVMTLIDPVALGPDGKETRPPHVVFKTTAGLGLGASAEAACQAYRQYAGDSPSEDWLRFPKIGMECHTADGKVKDIIVMKAEEH